VRGGRVRALTVQQPWAWAIVHGGKDVENRTRNLAGSYRGPVAIHAGKQVSRDGVDDPRLRPDWAVAMGYVYVHRSGDRAEISYPDRAATQAPNRLASVMPLGAIIGVTGLVDVHVEQAHCCPDTIWAERAIGPGQPIVHLVLEHPRPLAEPVPCRGALGLWTPSAEVLAELEVQLSATSAADEPHHERDDADQDEQFDEQEQDLGGAHAAGDQGVHGRDGTR
jgi:hypothetical protein